MAQSLYHINEGSLHQLATEGILMSIKTITPADVFRLQQESGGITLIDVRETGEFREVWSPLAVNFPLSTFDVDTFGAKRDKKTTLYMLCRSGKRSLTAAQLLEGAGFESLYNVEGGMLAWESVGLPVRRS